MKGITLMQLKNFISCAVGAKRTGRYNYRQLNEKQQIIRRKQIIWGETNKSDERNFFFVGLKKSSEIIKKPFDSEKRI